MDAYEAAKIAAIHQLQQQHISATYWNAILETWDQMINAIYGLGSRGVGGAGGAGIAGQAQYGVGIPTAISNIPGQTVRLCDSEILWVEHPLDTNKKWKSLNAETVIGSLQGYVDTWLSGININRISKVST